MLRGGASREQGGDISVPRSDGAGDLPVARSCDCAIIAIDGYSVIGRIGRKSIAVDS